MSEFQFNCMTHANHLMRTGSRQHHLTVLEAKDHQQTRAENREYRLRRRQKIAETVVNICLGAAIAISLLAAIGFLTTAAT
jgi:hypothetical protein